MVVLCEGGRDAASDKLGLSLGEPAKELGPPEPGEFDSDGVDGVDRLLGLGDNGVVDVCEGVVEGRVRVGCQRTGASGQRTRASSQRARG